MRFAVVAVGLCLVLSGCGGSPKESAPTKKVTATETTPAKVPKTAKATVGVPTGVPAPEDLNDFQCAADKEGVWKASGVLRNGSKNRATYQVTVFVGEANGEDGEGMTKRVESVLAGGSSRVSVSGIPADEEATQCFVQVLRKQ